MSRFSVNVEKIGKVVPHPNADRLDLAELEGIPYQFIIAKGQFKPGDSCVYFPIDAILPDEVADKMGLKGKLSGKNKSRVKSIRLRGSISQGVVADVSILEGKEGVLGDDGKLDYMEALGVTKYEEEEYCPGGPNRPASVNMNPKPEWDHLYDIENFQKYSNVVELLLDKEVWVSCKMEGQHISCSILPSGEIVVCSRRCKVTMVDTSAPESGTPYVPKDTVAKSTHQQGYENACLESILQRLHAQYPDKTVTIRGEVLGNVQGNIYKLTKMTVRLFEIELDSQPLPAKTFIDLTTEQERVPTIFVGTLKHFLGYPPNMQIAMQKLKDMANGLTVFGNNLKQLREGIVIRPYLEELFVHGFGRVIIKSRSAEYLAQSDL